MPELTISTELVRHLRHQAPKDVTDYRDPKLPGFVHIRSGISKRPV